MALKYQVLIPVKNGMPYLAEAVYSILRSKGLNEIPIQLEVHISDAGSKDGTIDFLRSIESLPGIKVHLQESISREENWNFVSSFASGDFVRLLCADDRITEFSISNSVISFLTNSRVNVVCGKRNIINDEGNVVLEYYGTKDSKMKNPIPGRQLLKKSLLAGTNILGEPSNVTFRTKTFSNALPWSDEYPYCLDLSLYIKVLGNELVLLEDSLHSEFRVHRKSLSHEMFWEQSRQYIAFTRKNYGLGTVDLKKSELILSHLRAVIINLKRVIFYLIFLDNKFSFLRRFIK